ncbi:MAG: Rne/Rng family ribonuclease [Actinomycetota bacterium]|nr:Rne/Rng family ribonuclease [Actinomycetota bacterium]
MTASGAEVDPRAASGPGDEPVAAVAAVAGDDASTSPPRPKIGDSRPAPPPPPPARAPGRTINGAGRAGSGTGQTAGPGGRGKRGGSASGRGTRTPSSASNDETGPSGADGIGISDRRAKGRRRGGRARTGSSQPGTPVEATLVDEPAEVDAETMERRKGRERKGRPVGRYLMVVHAATEATQIAVLEGRNLVEHYVSRPTDDANQIDGNIYVGRVKNVLPGMEAAFVDIGTPKNAVLYRGDVRYDGDDIEGPDGDIGGKKGDGKSRPTRGHLSGAARNARIEQLLSAGQTIVCQVTKNPIGAKGARLTQEVSLPGRFVVLVPNSDTYGISKRLADDERKRLRRILDQVRPEGHGLIVRTAAEGATPDELSRDVARLLDQWHQIEALAATARGAGLVYKEPDLAVRVIREEFNRNYRGVIIDDEALYNEVKGYVASISPELADRVELASASDDPLPVFERHHVHEQIHKALDRKVWLPSGGSLIIERTEALTVIDVNTGKNVGRSNLEETVYRNNLEAAEEIAHQLRLRDIGGIIVIDFIDMEIAANRAEVIKTFRSALARDKTRTQVFDISELGLVEMTRKRISEGLVESFSNVCPTCGGRGIIIDEALL